MLEKRLKIRLESLNDICEFGKKVTMFKSDINIIKGSVVCDAKSIMGVFHINPLEDVYVEIITDDAREIKEFNDIMSQFVLS